MIPRADDWMCRKLTLEEQKAVEDDLKAMGFDEDKDQLLVNTDEGPKFVDWEPSA